MMSDRAHRSVYVETALSLDDLRTALNQCGEIRGMHPAGNSENSTHRRYFVEYRGQQAVKRAYALQLPETSIYLLHKSPHLLDHFYASLSPDLPPKPQVDVLQNARWEPYHKNHRKTRNTQPKEVHRPSTYPTTEPPEALPPPTPSDSSESLAGVYPTSGKENHGCCRLSPAWDDSLSLAAVPMGGLTMFPTAYMHPDVPYPDVPYSDVPYPDVPYPDVPYPDEPYPSSMFGFPEQLPLPPHSSQTLRLPHFYGNDDNPVDLDHLAESPEEVINTLKVIANDPAECGQWITVGAHYRSRKNLRAAIIVIAAMLEVMLAQGMNATRLKPAYLMLSSCHLDIAQQLRAERGRDTVESKFHLDKACDGFRKVYGAFEPPPCSLPDDNATRTSSSPAPPLEEPKTCPRSPARQLSTPKPMLRTAQSGGTPGGPPASSSSPSSSKYGQVKMLEREIQALRGRQDKQKETLDRARSTKRKLEDELAKEHHKRRKLEGELERAERAAAGAQRGEEYALEQCRVEVETRRRAEGRIEELKKGIAAVELRVAEGEERERKTREYFGKLGVAFLKAARGDASDAMSTPAMVRF